MIGAPSFATLAAMIDRAESDAGAAGKALAAISGGGPMGLTPDAVKASPEWRAAHAGYARAAAILGQLNSLAMRHHKPAMIERARARRFAKMESSNGR